LSITSLLTAVPVGIIAAIAIPNLLQARMAANEGSAIYSLRTISSAEMTYQSQFQKFATLEELAAANLIDPKLASGTKNGYRFTVELTSGNSAAEEFETSSGGFAVSCVPVDYRSSGRRSFYVDQTNVVRGADNVGMPASTTDPPLEMRPLRSDWERSSF
jgi:type II secretory pathway pseudopilin PulG